MRLTRQQITLVGIFALFLGPVLLVMLMQSRWWHYQPDGMRNLGHLVRPPVHLSLNTAGNLSDDASTQGFKGKWLLLYVLSETCDQVCEREISALRQIHKATGRQQQHLAIAILSKNGTGPELHTRLESIYSKLNFISDSSATILKTLDAINGELASREGAPASYKTYILDPMQNVILAFEDGANPGSIHKDLKRLLKWSAKENQT